MTTKMPPLRYRVELENNTNPYMRTVVSRHRTFPLATVKVNTVLGNVIDGGAPSVVCYVVDELKELDPVRFSFTR